MMNQGGYIDIEYLPNLELGSTEVPEIRMLQQQLRLLQYFPSSITGSFGPETQSAVSHFQNDYGLPVTGVVDDRTWEALLRENGFYPFSAIALFIDKPTLRLGSTGQEVGDLQRQLQKLGYYQGPINQIFDKTTENAVKAFQLNNKLLADGIVGRNTWNSLSFLYGTLALCDGEESNYIYIVKPGDTLYGIARMFDVSVEEIKMLNGLTSNIIHIGQELRIPNHSVNPPAVQIYNVRAGDTLYSIARAFGTTVEEIKTLNELTSNTIHIGQELKIPSGVIPTPPTIIYVVRAGDTLYSIARAFGTTVEKIKTLNGLTSNLLSIGQQLRISSSS